MKRLYSFIAWLLIAGQAFAGIEYNGPSGGGATAYYALVKTGASTFKGFQLPEGSTGGAGLYSITDAALVLAGMTGTPGDYTFRIFAGTVADVPTGSPLGGNTLGWTGTIERPVGSNPTYAGGSPIKSTNGYVQSIDASHGPPRIAWHDGNDTTSGDTLRTQVAALAKGETLYISGGTFATGDNQLVGVEGATIDGSGIDVTRITNARVNTSSQFKPGTRGAIKKLTWQSLNVTDGNVDTPIGTFAGDSAINDTVFEQLKVIGRTDNIVQSSGTTMSFSGRKLLLNSNYDTIALFGQGNPLLQDVIANVDENTSIGVGRGIINSGGGEIIGDNIDIRMRAIATTTYQAGIVATSRNTFFNSRINLVTPTTPPASLYSIFGASGSQSVHMINGEYDRSKAVNNINDQSPLHPTVSGRRLAITPTGATGIDFGNVENPTTTLALTGTTFSPTQVVASVTGNVGGNVVGSVASIAAGGIASTSFAANSITAAAVASDAATEIGAAAAGGNAGGPIEQRKVAAARLLLVKTRTDGTFGVNGRVRMSPNDTLLWGLECSPQLAAGANTYGISPLVIGGADAAKLTVVTRGVSDTKAKFELHLDATATAANVITLVVPVQLSATETINVNVGVTVGP